MPPPLLQRGRCCRPRLPETGLQHHRCASRHVHVTPVDRIAEVEAYRVPAWGNGKVHLTMVKTFDVTNVTAIHVKRSLTWYDGDVQDRALGPGRGGEMTDVPYRMVIDVFFDHHRTKGPVHVQAVPMWETVRAMDAAKKEAKVKTQVMVPVMVRQ